VTALCIFEKSPKFLRDYFSARHVHERSSSTLAAAAALCIVCILDVGLLFFLHSSCSNARQCVRDDIGSKSYRRQSTTQQFRRITHYIIYWQ